MSPLLQGPLQRSSRALKRSIPKTFSSFTECSVIIQDINALQVMPDADLIIIDIMGRSDLQAPVPNS